MMWMFRLSILPCLLFLALHSATTTAQLASTGFTVAFNNVYYYISPFSVGTVAINSTAVASATSIHGFYPITVVQGNISVANAATLVQNFTQQDDVFQTGFLQIVMLANTQATTFTTQQGTTLRIQSLNSTTIPTGPYFLEASSGRLYMTYRLYSDFSGSFSESLLQTPDGRFTFMSAQIPGTSSLTVGVPSRLYYTRTPQRPLAGVRIAVKDIFDLVGVKTSNGNRAYYNLYPPANATAFSMQRLIDAGAILVGHQKPSQFANGEQATADWVDYHSPFNPRGDGYQDPSSSSSGAGASIGSYPWLDIAIGSDTGGSIRGPAGVQGIFGNRPSHGLVPLSGVMPLSPTLDTAGFLIRDPSLWGVAQAVLYGSNYTNPLPTAYPRRILTYNYPTNASASNASALLIDFLNKLTTFLSANVTAVNLTSAWAAAAPANATTSLTTLLNLTYPILISKQQIALVRQPFYRDYAAIHDGRRPFVDPAPLVRWAFGDTYPNSTLQEALTNKTLFMDFFNSQILPRSNNSAQCSDALFIYPGSLGTSNARNVYIPAPSVPFGFSAGRISVFSEAPDSVFPIGQVPFFSNITQHVEFLPVAVDIMAAKGCDALLVKLAQDLVAAGILAAPKTGGTIYGGDVLMKRSANTYKMRYVG